MRKLLTTGLLSAAAILSGCSDRDIPKTYEAEQKYKVENILAYDVPTGQTMYRDVIIFEDGDTTLMNVFENSVITARFCDYDGDGIIGNHKKDFYTEFTPQRIVTYQNDRIITKQRNTHLKEEIITFERNIPGMQERITSELELATATYTPLKDKAKSTWLERKL